MCLFLAGTIAKELLDERRGKWIFDMTILDLLSQARAHGNWVFLEYPYDDFEHRIRNGGFMQNLFRAFVAVFTDHGAKYFTVADDTRPPAEVLEVRETPVKVFGIDGKHHIFELFRTIHQEQVEQNLQKRYLEAH